MDILVWKLDWNACMYKIKVHSNLVRAIVYFLHQNHTEVADNWDHGMIDIMPLIRCEEENFKMTSPRPIIVQTRQKDFHEETERQFKVKVTILYRPFSFCRCHINILRWGLVGHFP